MWCSKLSYLSKFTVCSFSNRIWHTNIYWLLKFVLQIHLAQVGLILYVFLHISETCFSCKLCWSNWGQEFEVTEETEGKEVSCLSYILNKFKWNYKVEVYGRWTALCMHGCSKSRQLTAVYLLGHSGCDDSKPEAICAVLWCSAEGQHPIHTGHSPVEGNPVWDHSHVQHQQLLQWALSVLSQLCCLSM